MSKRKRGDDCVPVDVCLARHEALTKEFIGISAEIRDIKRALLGEDLQSGLVGEIKAIKAKLLMASELRDWIRPLFIAAVASFITAVLFKFWRL